MTPSPAAGDEGGVPGDEVLRVRGLSKSFAGRRVLRDVDLSVRAGEVVGLVGQNGSGKSTLIKILSGYHGPDAGAQVWIGGAQAHLPFAPGTTQKLGLTFVHQDLGLAPGTSILENLRIGQFATGAGRRIDWKRERAIARAALAEFGLDFDPRQSVDRLEPVDRAMLAIVRALQQLKGVERGVLFLDEPTAYLPRDGLQRLYAAVGQVAAAGHGVVFVSHKLDEVFHLTDRIVVLRDGAVAATMTTGKVTEDAVVREILGAELLAFHGGSRAPDRPACLTVRGLTGSGLEPVDLSVGAAEIVGCTGLLGSGFERLPYLIFGAVAASAGEVEVEGATLPAAALRPAAAIAAGLALLPADRGRDSGVLGASAAENVTLATLPRYFAGGRLRLARERARAAAVMEEFNVVPRAPEQALAEFSGGNQQKLMFAKWCELGPRVFLMHEPAQGVDIGARQEIFRRIRAASDDGAAFLVASAEYADLARLCDRVLVFRHGRVVSQLTGGQLTEDRIVQECFRTDHDLERTAR